MDPKRHVAEKGSIYCYDPGSMAYMGTMPANQPDEASESPNMHTPNWQMDFVKLAATAGCAEHEHRVALIGILCQCSGEGKDKEG